MSCSCDNPINAGKLTKRITIEKFNGALNDRGGWEGEWVGFYTTKASIEPLSGGEAVFNERLQSYITHKIIIRYKNGITPAMRVRFSDRLFDIKSVINDQEKNKWIIMEADEGRGDGS